MVLKADKPTSSFWYHLLFTIFTIVFLYYNIPNGLQNPVGTVRVLMWMFEIPIRSGIIIIIVEYLSIWVFLRKLYNELCDIDPHLEIRLLHSLEY